MRSFLILTILFSAAAAVATEKLPRALVLTGGGLQTAIFLGMIDGVEEAGYQPDIVIGTCGSSLAAVLVQAIPDREARRRFMESREFYQILTSPKVNTELTQLQLLGMLAEVQTQIALQRAGKFDQEKILSIFKQPLMEVPNLLGGESFQRPFRDRTPRAVVVAARFHYGPADQGKLRKGAKLYQEVYFTDEATARLLEGLRSPVAGRNTPIAAETAAITDFSLAQAARAGVNDPFYINPPKFGDASYLAGSINLYPIELAEAVAEQVVMTYPDFFSDLEQSVIQAVYGYSNNQRILALREHHIEHWIDFTDSDPVYDGAGFNPQVDKTKWHPIRSGFPATYEEFVRRVRLQFEYGHRNGLAAIRTPRDSRAHIQKKTAKPKELP